MSIVPNANHYGLALRILFAERESANLDLRLNLRFILGGAALNYILPCNFLTTEWLIKTFRAFNSD